MANKQDEETKYFGQSGTTQIIAIVVLGFIAVSAGWIENPFGDNASTETIVTSSVDLDSTFLSVVSANNTLADTDTNYDEDSGVITLPIDVNVSNDGIDTTFTMKAKNIAGDTVELFNFTNSGVFTIINNFRYV